MTPAPPIRPMCAGAKAIVMGSSQSGRFIRTLIHLGFNRDEAGKIVFEGALPHIGGGLMPLNIRFGQPGRATTNTVDHLFPGAEFPFAYAERDRSADRTHAGHPRPLPGERDVPEDRPCRDRAGDVGVAPVARLYRSARCCGISTNPPMSAATSWHRPSTRRRCCRCRRRSRSGAASSSPIQTRTTGPCARCSRISPHG